MQHVAPDDAARCNNSGRVTQAEAARRLEINRSSIKRYLDEYPELLAADGTIDFAELKKHRGDNPRIADPSRAPSERKPPKEAPGGAGRRGNKARLEEIRAWEAERDWAVSIGQLVDPTRQLDAAVEAAAALRDRAMAPEPTLCERLAEERDPRAVQALLRETNRAMLDDFIVALKKLFAPAAPPSSPPAGDADA